MRAPRALAVSALALTLGACAGLSWEQPPQRQVYNQPDPEPAPERPVGNNDHLVRKGDTVYSIAFRNNLDFRELAKWNGIGPSYLILPGQVLRLSPPPPPQLQQGDIVSHPTVLEEVPSSRPVALPVENLPVPPPVAGAAPVKPGPRKPIPLPPSSGSAPEPLPSSPNLPTPPVVATAPAAPAATPSLPPRVDPPPIVTSESGGPYRWQWPTNGVVVRGYNPATGSKGLDFSGDIGQPVMAAAPGKVVYSGSALKGYGELIIIKHDDLRLSAYGYNRKRLVEEGAMVRGGQTIAELGLGPESKPVLHFEIRERGQPVNPVPYLPAR